MDSTSYRQSFLNWKNMQKRPKNIEPTIVIDLPKTSKTNPSAPPKDRKQSESENIQGIVRKS